jgi:Flp pilus assembly protein TadB
MYERVQRLHAEEHKAVLASVQELTETLSAESRLRDQEAARRQEAQDQLRDVRSAADKLRVQVRREEAFVLLCFALFCFALFCFVLLCFVLVARPSCSCMRIYGIWKYCYIGLPLL